MARDHDRDEAPEDTSQDKPRKTPQQLAREREAERRARFASGIARSEFGRFYWDHGREARMRLERRRKPPGGQVLQPTGPNGVRRKP